MSGMGDGYVGTAQDAVRIRRLEKQREAERRKIQELKSKSASGKGQPGLLQFGSSTSEILETAFKKETVGLVTREQYVEKRVNIRNKIEEEEKEKLQKLKQEEEEFQLQKRKKRKVKGSSRLSFADDLENGSEEEDDGNKSPEPKSFSRGKFGKDPTVETSFLPDSEREAEERVEREILRKQWIVEQELIKNEPLEITYSYWDGAGHRRVIQARKGDTIGEFLRAVQHQLAPEFREIRTTTVENLLYVKEDLIIPHVTWIPSLNYLLLHRLIELLRLEHIDLILLNPLKLIGVAVLLDVRARPLKVRGRGESATSREDPPPPPPSAGNQEEMSDVRVNEVPTVGGHQTDNQPAQNESQTARHGSFAPVQSQASVQTPTTGRGQGRPVPSGSAARSRLVPSRGAARSGDRQPELVYATRTNEQRDEHDVIAGTFSISYFALLDIGYTHSYIASSVSGGLEITVENTENVVTVHSPVGKLVSVTKIYNNCPPELQGEVFPANLMELPFGEFDLILGMDWLSTHRVKLDCEKKRAILRISDN
ncbi:hypothetical protein GQ457_18G017970 [Hibiscus cannabinus]